MKVVIINGYPESGKDKFIDYCWDVASFQSISKNYKTHLVYNISTVDKVKEALKMLGWTGDKTPEARKLLSDLKKVSISNYNGPLTYITNMIDSTAKYAKTLGDSFIPVIFIHSREPEEIRELVGRFNAKTLFVKRDLDRELSNTSDSDVEDFYYDYTVNNNKDLDHLKQCALEFMEWLTNED